MDNSKKIDLWSIEQGVYILTTGESNFINKVGGDPPLVYIIVNTITGVRESETPFFPRALEELKQFSKVWNAQDITLSPLKVISNERKNH